MPSETQSDNPVTFGTSGIRGPVGDEVTASVALAVGRALGVDTTRVVVGRDPRESGKALVDALSAGLRESGTDVVDLGLAATPTIARAVSWEDADAGAAVTASHNPAQDNGIKLWQPTGQAFDADLREAIETRIEQSQSALADWDGFGDRIARDYTETHCEQIVSEVTVTEPLSVVVDVGNGAGGVTADALGKLGCELNTLNAQPDGTFPGRPSEPTAEHCEALTTQVAYSDAALGIAHDGDADRMRAVTADGEFLSGDELLAILAREAAEPGERVAVPVDTSLAVEDHLDDAGIETTRTPVGDVYVAQRASEPDVGFGGEPSGAWIWPDATLCPDGPLAACKLVSLAANRPLGDRRDDIETYPIHRDSIEVSDKAATMTAVHERVTEQYDDISMMDGVRVDRGDGWFLLRASGTQPLVRITAEARDTERASQLFEEASTILSKSLD
ncbi:phosphoglucosamine mutase [Halovenus rubra]|uniref:Phosphoglucosamine mutase n=2 Tax=Halovenus rubra TaxID=869890 RepID=A0ACC7E3F7_9EURY|nr:phosphoglucosamine mutase [Halovenus rubra]